MIHAGATPTRPLLLLDIDGVLSPYAASRLLPGHTALTARPAAWKASTAMVYPRPAHLTLQLSPHTGHRLQQLPFDLVWASPWRPEELAPLLDALGLPDALPAVPLRHTGHIYYLRIDDEGISPDAAGDQNWRAEDVLAWSRTHDRPFAWLAPSFTRHVREHTAYHHPAPVLLHRVDPACGLTDDDFTQLTDWAQRIALLPPPPKITPRRCRDCGEASTTVIAGRRVERTRCGSCCECYCPDPGGSDQFAPCGDLRSQTCPDCNCCRVCTGCYC